MAKKLLQQMKSNINERNSILAKNSVNQQLTYFGCGGPAIP